MQPAPWLIWWLTVAGAILATGLLGFSFVIAHKITHPAREPIYATPAEFGLQYEEVAFASRLDGALLRGWFLPAPGSLRTIIFSHGYSRNRLQNWAFLELAREAVARGYNALLFDYRAHGESGGEVVTVGDAEQEDLAAAIDYVRGRGESGERIALWGFSMGAATALVTAARMPEVEAVIADSPFADLRDYLERNLSLWSGLPPIFTPLLRRVTQWRYKIQPERVSPQRAICQISPRPVLLIHGTGDRLIPHTESEGLLAAAAHLACRLLVIEGAVHVGGYTQDPVRYVAESFGFLDQVFRPNG